MSNKDAKILIILQCAKAKGQTTCAVEEMYKDGRNFSYFLPILKQIQNSEIRVFSAKYGLVKLDDIISPYNATLERVPPGYARRYTKEYQKRYKEDAEQTEETLLPILYKQLKELRLDKYNQVLFLASGYYMKAIKKVANTKNFYFLQAKCGGTFKIKPIVVERLIKLFPYLQKEIENTNE